MNLLCFRNIESQRAKFLCSRRDQTWGSVKNNLVEFAPEFAIDLIDLIEQNRRNSELFRGLLRLKIG
nr:hypothetical protein GZ18F2_41 [uncultured archaeon GZfos18F2]